MTTQDFQYNKDQARRDALLFKPGLLKTTALDTVYNTGEYAGGIALFAGVTLQTLELLVKEKFLDPDEQQPGKATTSQFLDILRENPDCTAYGYAVTAERHDYRVTIDGIFCTDPNKRNQLRLKYGPEIGISQVDG